MNAYKVMLKAEDGEYELARFINRKSAVDYLKLNHSRYEYPAQVLYIAIVNILEVA